MSNLSFFKFHIKISKHFYYLLYLINLHVREFVIIY
nr:MAG TPA: hypothetical protein [Caudoviricetes sp.]